MLDKRVHAAIGPMLVASACLFAACEPDAAGATQDAAVALDAGVSVPPDAFVPPDRGTDASSAPVDANFAPLDAATRDDASVPSDAAAESDAASLRRGFPASSDPTKPGPFVTQSAMGENAGPNCVVHRPKELGADGVRHPVIVWGMGTGGFNTYQGAFDLWASHGFIVTASLLGDGQGDGAEMLACLSYVCTTYSEHVDCRAAATGHSQGGGGAIMAGTDPRVITTAPIQPYVQQGFGGYDQASISKQVGPMLLFSGTNDVVASPDTNQQLVYDRTNVPVVWANLIGGEHVSTGIDGAAGYRSMALAWFRLQLLDDPDYRATFHGPACTLCEDKAWIVQRKGID